MDIPSCSHLLERKNPSRLLEKALALMEHQLTKDDVRRHQQTIKEYLYVSREGFVSFPLRHLVRDLFNVMSLLDLVRLRRSKEKSFDESLDQLLDLCSIPPVLTRSLELLEYDMDMLEYFSWLGYMVVWLTEKAYQLKIVNSIYTLLTREYSQRHYLSLAVRKEKIHASRLSDVLADLLEIVEDDVYHKILKIIHLLMDGPKKTCEVLLKKGAVSAMIVRMEPTWMQRLPSTKPSVPSGREEIQHTDSIFYILTSLIAHANAQMMRAPTKSLQWAFRVFTMNPTTNVERNNVLAVLLLLMEIYPDLLLGNLTFAYDIAMLAMARDISFRSNWTSHIILTTSHEDHSCMSLLLMCISYFPNCLSGPKVAEEHQLLGLLIGN
ncbi:hypothetical protein HUJ04_002592 [Dendroctonus ponderosae]|nr:hypothetical protein HUJ04_002592 [Dendroctonus ponderosae]